MRKVFFVTIILSVIFTVSAVAQDFPIIGPRAQAMGGAFVAFADDATAAYWNPSAAPLRRLVDINILFNARSSQSWDMLSAIDDINDLDLANNPAALGDYTDILNNISANNPFMHGGYNWGVFYTNDVFTAAYMESSFITATATVDTQNLNASSTSPDYYMNNTSSLNFHRVKMSEYILGAGTLFYSQDSFIGVNVKYVNVATSTDSRLLIDGIESGYNEIDFAMENFSENEYTDSFVSFDVAAMIYLGSDLRVAVIGRNVLSPEFEVSEDEVLELAGQWRAGFMLKLAQGIIVTGDYDITKNTYFGSGPEFQQGALGTEVTLVDNVLYLRGGINTNLVADETEMKFCGGFGINMGGGVMVDAAAQYSPDRETLAAGIQVHLFYRSRF